MKKSLLILSLMFILSNFIFAQMEWKKTNGPYGGAQFDVACDNLGTIYAMPYYYPRLYTFMLKNYDNIIYYSNDKGKSWKSKIIDTVTCMTVDKKNNLLLAVKNKINFYDKNFNFIKSSPEFPFTFSADNFIKQIIFADNGNLYVNIERDSLYLSTDYGDSWKSILSNSFYLTLDSNKTAVGWGVNKVYRCDIDSFKFKEIIVADSTINEDLIKIVYNKKFDRFIAIGVRGYVYLSDDKGLTWRKGKDSIPIQPWNIVMTISSDNAGNVFITDTFSVYCSIDGGDSWNKLNGFNNYYLVINFSFDNDNNIVASDIYNGLLMSEDSGKTVKELNIPLTKTNITKIAMTRNGNIYAIYKTNYISYLYRSANSGDSWEHIILPYPYNSNINSLLILKSGEILVATRNALLHYSDELNNWVYIDTSSIVQNIYAMEELNNGGIVASMYYNNYNYLFVSKDTCKSWDTLTMWNILIDKIKSNDKGWVVASGNDPYFGIYFSKDNCNTWNRISLGSPDFGETYINENFLYTLTAWGYSTYDKFYCYDSTSTKISESNFSNQWNDYSINNDLLVAGKYNDVYICPGFDLLCTYNNGISWDTINKGMENIAVYDVFFDKNNIAYAGTERNGVYRCDNFVGVKEKQKEITNDNFQIFPNPASEFIEITGINNLENNIQIYNILGEQVLTSSIFPIPYSKKVDISALAAGVYYVKIGNEAKMFVKE